MSPTSAKFGAHGFRNVVNGGRLLYNSRCKSLVYWMRNDFGTEIDKFLNILLGVVEYL